MYYVVGSYNPAMLCFFENVALNMCFKEITTKHDTYFDIPYLNIVFYLCARVLLTYW